MEAMTQDEKQKFEKMEGSIERIQQDVNSIKTALLGNEMLNDGGLVGQMKVLKTEHEGFKAELKSLSEERVKNGVYVKIITWLLGVIGVGVVSLIINYFK